ncbi:MAG: hypothetical protein QW702_07160 [Candidatus Bathyarchaeia archaeon]
MLEECKEYGEIELSPKLYREIKMIAKVIYGITPDELVTIAVKKWIEDMKRKMDY